MEKNYFKLLTEKKFCQQNDIDFLIEKEREFAAYSIRISDHFRWKEKDKFVQAMTNLLEKQIDLDQYIDQFYQIQDQINQLKNELQSDFDQLVVFEPDPRSKGFSRLIENLFSDIRICELDDELRTDDEISEEDLRDGIREFLPKIESYNSQRKKAFD